MPCANYTFPVVSFREFETDHVPFTSAKIMLVSYFKYHLFKYVVSIYKKDVEMGNFKTKLFSCDSWVRISTSLRF